jgi:multisubunit Na+/H+ antiporter MnhB subunit
MRSSLQNAALDALALATFSLLFAAWLLVEFVLYPGGGFWGLSLEAWSEVYFWSFPVVVAVAVVHLAFHGRWSTLLEPSRKTGRRRIWLALAGLAAMLALVAVSLFATVQHRTPDAPHGRQASYTAPTYVA